MEPQDPRLGAVLHERYRVRERLTEGSMGVVYVGERIGLNRQVAIKFLNESYAATKDGMRRFEVEARAMSKLSHPNCVPVTDFGLDQGAPYLVMDFVTGRTLRELLRDEGRVAPVRALDITRQILAGLTHAHRHDIVHRDIKPENIVVTAAEGHGEQIRILDFGLAKLKNEASATTGVAVGTPGYMSPEQTVAHKVDGRADIYATGIILYELLTGVRPFQAQSPFEVMRMHREAPPPPLTHAAPDGVFSAELEAVVQRALAKDREARWPSAAEFSAAIEALPERRTAGTGTPHRGRALLAVAALVTAAAVGIGVWWAQRPSEQASAEPAAAVVENAPRTAPAAPPSERTAAAPVAEAVTELPVDAAPTGDAAAPADVTALLELAAGGDTGSAIEQLEGLAAADPARADVQYALGTLYAGTQAWTPAVAAYARAILLDEDYAGDPRLIGDVVEALGSDAHKDAEAVVRHHIGQRALPRLEQASRSADDRVRTRADRLLKRLAD